MPFSYVLRNVLFGIPIGITIIDIFGYIARVDGVSMQPALNPDSTKDYVFLNKLSVKFYEVSRGDVVALLSPKDPELKLIKRVIGLEGDTINTLSYKSAYVTVPEGHCWVEGDNAKNSMDSNSFGPIALALITAKATAIVWPPRRWQFVKSEIPEKRKPIELDFSGAILADAVALGDIDNDGENELVIGTINGELSIFKGEKLWQTISGLGMIASVGVGDIMKCGSNAVVAISGEGWCYFYMCINQNKPSPCEKLHLVYQRRIPTNTKVMVLGDIQGDGQIDMVLGLTDRVVRIYRWLQTREVASLVCLNKCECASQIGSVCIGRDNKGNPCVLVSQPGATYMTISNSYEENPLVEYHEVPLPKLTATSISSQVVGCVGDDQSICMVSLDGTVSYINKQKLLWTVNVEQQLFKAGRISVCKDDSEEQLVAGAWSGHTFIIDCQSNIVCFEVGQAIQSFLSGTYANKKSTSFIYVTYSNKIFVYYDISIERMVLYNLYILQSRDPELSSYSQEELKELTELCLYHLEDGDQETSQDSS